MSLSFYVFVIWLLAYIATQSHLLAFIIVILFAISSVIEDPLLDYLEKKQNRETIKKINSLIE